VIAPVALKFVSDVRLFAPGTTRSVEVEVTAFRPDVAVNCGWQLPRGWTIAPAAQTFRIAMVGGQAQTPFHGDRAGAVRQREPRRQRPD